MAPCPSRATGCTLPAARFSGTQQLSRSKNSFPYRQDGKTGSTASTVTRGPHLGELPSQQPGQKGPLTCLCRTEPLAGISSRGLLSSEHLRPSLSFEPRGDSSDSASDGPEARPGREPPGKRPSTLGKLDVHSGLCSHCRNRVQGAALGGQGGTTATVSSCSYLHTRSRSASAAQVELPPRPASGALTAASRLWVAASGSSWEE